jgi:hypothetical protein
MRRSPHLRVAGVQPDLDGSGPYSILKAVNASPIMSAADSRDLMSLATAGKAMERPSANGDVAMLLQARQLAEARSQLRQGETFSVLA